MSAQLIAMVPSEDSWHFLFAFSFLDFPPILFSVEVRLKTNWKGLVLFYFFSFSKSFKSQNANIKDSLAWDPLHQPPPLRPWHLSERNAPIWAPRWVEMRPPPPTQGHTAPEPKHRTIWCESGLMKVQHGAKWVSTTAGWGANDKTAPWAHCCCWYLCQGIWQLAECLTSAISY